MRTATPIGDRLESVIGAERHRSIPTGHAGGEWDAWRALPARTRRQMIGAGYATPGGLPPDVLADLIARNHGTDNYRDALEWFYRTAQLAIAERRTAHQRDRRAAAAKAAGHPTYYAYRTALAHRCGYRSLWQYRKARGWT